MQTNELKELYKEKTGAAPSEPVGAFIDGLKTREIAKVWSVMSNGEEFVAALAQALETQLKKYSDDVSVGKDELEKWSLTLQEKKAQSPTKGKGGAGFDEVKPSKPIEEMSEVERKAYEDALAAEKLRKEAAALEEKKAALRAQIAARQAKAKEANAAADAAAASAAAKDAHQDPVPEAPAGMETFEEADDDDDEAEEPSSPVVQTTITIKLNDASETLGVQEVMAAGGKLRALSFTPGGACERAGVRPCSVIFSLDGEAVTEKQHVLDAMTKIREAGKTEFPMVVEAPATEEQLEKAMQAADEMRLENAKKKIEYTMKNAKLILLEFYLVGAREVHEVKEHKVGKEREFFAEVKLRTVTGDGKIGPDHPNPQKTTTKTVKGATSFDFDHHCQIVAPPSDCIRVSLFYQKRLGKDTKGRADLILPQVLPKLTPDQPEVQSYPVVDDAGKPTGAHVDVVIRIKGFSNKGK
eukprot:TRINITY_DN796_c0_g1_i1.p2 TRINITY_DN796_c0_g1~~TRINITY_DN796_c0_g1_i1.p2  ORF type:complete len:469 (+),score=231.00 TRINITY_DN796_c0_g1_i1:69-1475(+)